VITTGVGSLPHRDLAAAAEFVPATAAASLRPPAISLDAVEIGIGFLLGIERLARAVSEGARMIWGAVPTDACPVPDPGDLIARVRRAEGALAVGGRSPVAVPWVSAACGLAGLSEEQAAVVAGTLAEVAEGLSG
jgi:hypothetical protein